MTTAPAGASPRGRYRKPLQSPPKRSFCGPRAMFLLRSFQKQGLPASFPGVPLVNQRAQIDDAEIEFLERAVDRAIDRHAARRLDDALAFRRQHEIREEQRRVRMRRLFSQGDAVGAAE